VVLSTQGGHPVTIFDSQSYLSAPSPILPKVIQTLQIPPHWRQIAMLAVMYITHLDHISFPLPPHPTLVMHSPRTRTGLCRSAGVPTPISSSPPVTRRGGRVPPVGVVCYEQGNRYSHQHAYIYIQGEVRWDFYFLDTYLCVGWMELGRTLGKCEYVAA
jgi:hypothetical protein